MKRTIAVLAAGAALSLGISVPAHADVWEQIRQCESSGNPRTNTGNGFYGAYQFTLSSWRWVGGSGYPHHASLDEQTMRAKMLVSKQGFRNAFPACSAKLGLG